MQKAESPVSLLTTALMALNLLVTTSAGVLVLLMEMLDSINLCLVQRWEFTLLNMKENQKLKKGLTTTDENLGWLLIILFYANIPILSYANIYSIH